MTSLKGADEKWQSLERKLRRGKSLEQAASEAGADLEEAKAWLEARRSHRGFDDDSLALVGAEALHHGIEVLIELSKLREGRTESTAEISKEGRSQSTSTHKLDFPDLAAAQELVRTSLKIRQLLTKPAGKSLDGKDLFDDVPEAPKNWSFPKLD